MTWSYSGDPTTSRKDELRFLIGDTDSAEPLLQDEELDYILSKQASIYLAAAVACDTIAAKFSREADTRAGPGSRLSVALSQRAKAYRAMAAEFRQMVTGEEAWVVARAIPYVGGLSLGERQADAADEDLIQPRFERDMHSPDP